MNPQCARTSRRIASTSLVATLVVLFPPALRAQTSTDSTWRQHGAAAQVAYRAGRYDAYRAQLMYSYDSLSGHPDVVYALSRAEARLGNRKAALDWLRTYADMHLAFGDRSRDSDFVSIASDPEYQALLGRIATNAAPVSHATTVATIPDSALLTEDIAYDPGTRTFFVSSIRQRKIIAIDAQGHARDFVTSARDGVWGMLALRADPARHTLWATSVALPQQERYEAADSGRNAVLIYDLSTGALRKRYDFTAPGRHVLGDMTVDAKGVAYIADALSGGIYRARPEADTLEQVVAPQVLVSPQTSAVAPDGSRLFVADYVRGIAVVDLASGSVSYLPKPRSLAVNGIDGLYLTGTTMYAVQNGTNPARVVRMTLSPTLDRVVSWELVESGTPTIGQPTHGVVAGNDFYYLVNTGWENMSDDGPVNPGAVFTRPRIMKASK